MNYDSFGSILNFCGCFIFYTTIAVFKDTCFGYFIVSWFKVCFGFAKIMVFLIYWWLELKTKVGVFLSPLD